MRQLGIPMDGDGSQFGITELHYQGSGKFTAGQTIVRNSSYAERTLAQMGWDGQRGTERHPVWIKVHSAI